MGQRMGLLMPKPPSGIEAPRARRLVSDHEPGIEQRGFGQRNREPPFLGAGRSYAHASPKSAANRERVELENL